MKDRFQKQMRFTQPLKLKGFETLWADGKPYDPKQFSQHMFTNLSFQEHYAIFRKRICDSIGRWYLPVYRMADGEFKFCLSHQSYQDTQIGRNSLFKKVSSFVSFFKDRVRHKGLSTMWGENYDYEQLAEVRKKYIRSLKEISETGFLALHFLTADGGNPYAHYNTAIYNWLEVNDIELSEKNYTSFYFVYALLTGRDRQAIFADKNILIVTASTEDKRAKIKSTLQIERVKSVQFYDISPNKSMFDVIDLTRVVQPVDVVLVGAGIGSSNILVQLRELNTVCLDSGIVIECLANPELKKSRLFLYQQ